jgi:molybdopterin molybdotransferase
MLSSLGLVEVSVRIRPRVSILSTGDEVVEAGTPLGPGQIYSSNSHSLAGMVLLAGGIPIDRGNAPDDPAILQDYLQRCTDADLILTTGGVSVGDFDYVVDAFEQQGSRLDFWKVAIKPGKPLAYGHVGGVRTFGLPGNPVSCMVGFLQFVRPAIRRMLGDARPFLPVVEAVLAEPISHRPGRALFCRVALRTRGGELLAFPTLNQSSGALSSMVEADGFALLGRESEGLAAGEQVRVQVIGGAWGGSLKPDYGW